MFSGRNGALKTVLRFLSAAVVLAFAFETKATQSPEGDPASATAATALGQLAASMAPGTWAELPTLDMVPTLAADGRGGSILDYAEDGAWDPGSEQFLFIGSDHPNDANGDLARFVAYSAATNSWRIMPTPYWIPDFISHGYDHNAIDAAHGLFYHRTYSTRDVFRYDIAAGTWSQLPTIPTEVMGYATCCMGLEYFPELNGLILAGSTSTGTPDEAYFYSDSTAQWSRIASGTPMGTYNHFVEYNPVHKLVLYGGGNDNRQIYSISATGVVTPHPDAPIPLGVQNAIVTVDPVGGDFLVLGKNGEFYSYDVLSETWTALPGSVPVFSPVREPILVWQTLATPVSSYGVVMFVKFYFEDPVSQAWVYLYKHTASTDTTPPTDPTSLRATATGTGQIDLAWTASTDIGGSGVADYRVERCQGAGCTGFVEVASPVTNSFSDMGLAVSTTYRYRVRARDLAGNSSFYSNVAGATTTVSSGLVAAYGFGEGAGSSVADASGNANTGAITGATWITGKFGSALDFNGAAHVVLVPSSTSLDLSTGMTLQAWVYPTASQIGWRAIIQRETDAFFLHAGSGLGTLRPATGGTFDGTLDYFRSSNSLSVNVWSHLAATWDGSRLRLYLNGTEIASHPENGTLQGSSTGAGAMRIGNNVPYGERFIGRIDEVRVYSRPLSEVEIAADMNAPVVATATGPPGVPDGVFGPAMTVSKNDSAGNSLTLSWDTVSCPGAAGYHLVYGGGSQLPAASGGVFGVGGTICSATPPYAWNSPPTTIDPGGLVWWLVVATDASGVEGSWGADGSGAERNGPGPGGSSGSCGTSGKSVSNSCGH